jgi:addiction module RelB/DinJ family antitoxin
MKTILNIKTDKSLKLQAQKTAEEFGIPLGTIMNAFLRQFVRSKEISLDLSYQPTKQLIDTVQEAQEDFKKGNISGPFTETEFITHLKKL